MEYSELDLKSPKVLFKAYLDDFPTLGIHWNQSFTEWTSKNLDYFRNLGKSIGSFCYPDPETGAVGYLVDLCWEEKDEQREERVTSKYRWLELALEQEWSNNWDAIFADFSKLTDIKAKIKVFICFPKEVQRDELTDQLAHWVSISGIKHPDESYLVIIFSRNGRRKESERLKIEGYEIDYRGLLWELHSRLFPD
jgi:hypothetical protein